MSKTVDDLLLEFDKKHSLKVGKMADVVSKVQPLPTGSLVIDWMSGIGGLPQGRVTELYGLPSSGKAQPLDALVLTPGGFVKMGELRVGDALVDPFGDVSEVLGVFPQGVQPIYRVSFSDGTATEATGDHLWTVEVWVQAFGWLTATVTTDQLLRRVQASSGRPRTRLPQVKPVALASSGSMPLDPYLLGLLLGDGGLSGKAILFTTTDGELLDAVRALSPVDCDVQPQSARVSSISWHINGMTKYIRDLGLSGLPSEAKFVPELYKHQPAEARQALLQGLMDTDGHASSGQYNAGHGTAEFCSASRQLANDVIWLARSLGLKVVEGKPKKTSYRGADGTKVPGKDSYRVRIYQTDDQRVFRLPRKLKPIAPGLHRNRELVSVEHVRDVEAQCISVSAASKLYVTNDFIPTHNTTTALQTAVQLQRQIIDNKTDDRILYLDFEKALDADYAASLGLDLEHPSLLLAQPSWLEQGAEAAIALINTGKVRLSIWDSVAAMASKRLVEGGFDQATAAMHRAKLMSGLLQTLVGLLDQRQCAGVFINHMMESVEMSGRPGLPPKTTTPGGRALKFYASLRLEFKQGKNITSKVEDLFSGEDTNQAVATQVYVKAVKNKVGPPFRTGELRSRFGMGFDNAWSALQVLTTHKQIISGSAGYYYFDRVPQLLDDDMPVSSTGRPNIQGEANLLAFADEHPVWRDNLIAAALAELERQA